MTHMSFGRALELLRTGHRVSRVGWRKRDHFLDFLDGVIWAHTPSGARTRWVPTETDILAEDWGTAEEMTGEGMQRAPEPREVVADQALLADDKPLRDPKIKP